MSAVREGSDRHSLFTSQQNRLPVREQEVRMLDSDGVTAGPIAFVLSGGGSIGSIQVGMLHALYVHIVFEH